jgi:hypothetical protein
VSEGGREWRGGDRRKKYREDEERRLTGRGDGRIKVGYVHTERMIPILIPYPLF